MKLMVFGATGGTGAQVAEQAVTAGHQVTVVARNPTGVTVAAARVVPGDVLRPNGWRAAMAGQDAVVSCLGSTNRRVLTTVYSEGTTNILEAMRETGVPRILCLSSGGVDPSPETPLMQRLVIRFVIQRMYRHAYADMLEMERVVRDSGVAWTVVRPPMLTNGPLTADYRTAVDSHVPDASSLSRADLAHFLLAHLDDEATHQSVVEISR